LPALIDGGLSLVISPLLSLIRDQVHAMNKLIPNCAASFSGENGDETRDLFKRIETGSVSLLFVTPEKVHKSKKLLSALQRAHDIGTYTL
jgi:superfamily II DNA helicase RecQ